jgi:endonuclease-8
MPEGPEIRRAADKVARVLVGNEIEHVAFGLPRVSKTGRQLRIELCTSTHRALLYSASDIEVLTERQLTRHPFQQRVGPWEAVISSCARRARAPTVEFCLQGA